jgi:DNA-binding SARP family transcriptional activator
MNNKVTYRQQYTRCGKQRCRKCREGAGHGPYWYAYWSANGRTVSKYIGTHLPVDLEATRQPEDETAKDADRSTVQPPPTPVLRIYLLGQFRIERWSNNGWTAVDSRIWHRRRARALLGCLLSSPGRRLGREQVMDLLWPDLDIDVAANRLNGAVHELRQILEPEIARPASSRLLRLERDILELAGSTQIWVDAEVFENLLKEANTTDDPEEVAHLLEEASALYKGQYLIEELYSEWAALRRDTLQRAWIGLQLNMASLHAKAGASISAIQILEQLRNSDPTNETALQRLMILLTQLDRRGEALQIYRQHASRLQREYESEPLPETVELYEALCRGHVPSRPSMQPQQSMFPEKEIGPSFSNGGQKRAEFTFSRPLFQLGRHNQSPLIGRNQELIAMRQVIQTIEAIPQKTEQTREDSDGHLSSTEATTPSRARRPQFILLRGEAGIGKTRLAEEISLEAYERGWAVAWSRSYEQEGTIPYRPWTEILRTLLQGNNVLTSLLAMTSDPDGTEPLLSPLKLERLSVLLPDLADYIPPTRIAPALPHEQERLHLWEAATGLLSALGKLHPLLLVLDDLHWTDDSSIELLAYLIHRLQDQRILLIATCREGELAPQHRLRTLIADLYRDQAIVPLQVQPLTQTQIGTLVSHLPRNVVQSIQAQAAGNPFFAEELARYVGTPPNEQEPTPMPPTLPGQGEATVYPSGTSTGPLSSQKAGWKTSPSSRAPRLLPEPIAAVLERRMSRLSSDCQTLLGKAAVLGGSFELNQLVPMANEHDEDTILDLLEEALRAGLLTEEGKGAHITYHFWHPLIIGHLYERLSAARRAQLHRKAAEALKAAYTSTHQEQAAAIVYHLSRGSSDSSQIAYYAEIAGNQAYLLAAYSEAQQYYLQALQAHNERILPPLEDGDIHAQIQRITANLPVQRPPADPLHVYRILELVAECSMVLGNAQEARQLYDCILALRTSHPSTSPASPALQQKQEASPEEAQIQALLWREIGNTWAATGDYNHAYECYSKGKDVMDKAGITSGAAWACLHLLYGEMLRLQGHYHDARRYLEEALHILEHVVHQPAVLSTDSKGGQDSSTTPARMLQTRTERALLGDPLEIGYAHERLGIVAASVGQLSDALQHMHLALSIFEQSELVSEMARVCGNLGAAYATRGDQARGYEYMQRSLNLAERTGDLPNMTFVMGNLGGIAHRAGNLLEAERWFKRCLELADYINDRGCISWFTVELAAVQQDQGKLREAANNLHRSLTTGRAIKNPRSIRYALIGLGDLRILEALVNHESLPTPDKTGEEQDSSFRRALLRARSTLQWATSLGELEAEAIVYGKHLLATISFLLGEKDAYDTALHVLKEAQENELTRMIGRLYHLLGKLLTAKGEYEQAESYFSQAIQIFRTHELRLDHARALHSYGLYLLQRTAILPSHHPSADLQQARSSLEEARSLFVACHAAIDLTWVERTLAQTGQPPLPTRKALKH